MQELFGERTWVQPLAIAGSHLAEKEKPIDENINPIYNSYKLFNSMCYMCITCILHMYILNIYIYIYISYL